ncbi:MAG: glycosyltransferase family 2 protein, partial [bacterium]|nr:glycosyltransferase family 2 protein [bacterium]
MLSVVIPVFNEAPSLQELHAELHWALAYQGSNNFSPSREGERPVPARASGEGEGNSLEIIFVDDGSTDHSWDVLREIATKDPRVVLVRLRRNSGKSAAYAAGFREARGDIIATLDADLQDDPAELLKLLELLHGMSLRAEQSGAKQSPTALGAAEIATSPSAPRNDQGGGMASRNDGRGYDLVVGWKRDRQDSAIKVWSSRCFNAVLGWMCGTRLHDQNSGIRVLRREVAAALPLRGDLYRMIPALAAMQGFRVAEVPVHHRPRQFGVSKYGRTGLRRTFRGLFD